MYIKKYLISALIVIVILVLLINVQAGYTLEFDHHSYKDLDIVYVYSQQGTKNWSNAVTTGVQNWNNATLSGGSTKPTIVKGTLSWEVYVVSKNYGATGWDGKHEDTYETTYGHIIPPSTIKLNDYYTLTSSESIHVVAHEFGHEYGLGDLLDSSESGNLMYYITNSVTKPQSSDLEGVKVKSDICRQSH